MIAQQDFSFAILLVPTAMMLGTIHCYLALYPHSDHALRRALVSAGIFLFVFIAASTEILGAFNLINRYAVTACWIVLNALLAGYWLKIKGIRGVTIRSVVQEWLGRGRNFYTELGPLTSLMLLILFLITLVVAIIAPPNNQDSMSYHLSRLGYWVQQGNVAHYASHIERSIAFSPFSEYVHLHALLLSGSDRFFQLLQWSCLVGIAAVLSMIVRLFSASATALRLGICFAVTLPIVVLESMTTQNDLVVAFFVIATAFFVFDFLRNNRVSSLYFIPPCCALGMMTKGTFLFYVLPFGVFLVVSMLLKPALRRYTIRFIAASLLLTLAFNVPFWYRTYEVFGSPVGTISDGNQNHLKGIADYISSVSKHLFLHLGFVSPGNRYNDFLQTQLVNLHSAMGIQLDQIGMGMPFKMNKLNFNEDFAHNFLGIWLILLCIPLVFFVRMQKAAKWYSALALLSMLIFCFFISYQTYGSRLHITFFLLAAPVVGLVYDAVLPTFATRILTAMLWLAALPFALLSASHPLLSTKWFFENVFPPINSALHLNIHIDATNTNLKQESVLFVTPGQAFWGDHWPETEAFLARVNALNPHKIGFNFTEASFDYAYQALLRKPGREFAHVLVRNPSRMLENPRFQPDVIISEKDEGGTFGYHGKTYRLDAHTNAKWLYVPID